MSEDPHTAIINSQLATSLSYTIRRVDLSPEKEASVLKKLQFLQDIVNIHSKTDHQLYQEAVSALSSERQLYQFEAECVQQALIDNYLSQCECFREAFEIAVLRKQADKYSHLSIPQPVIKVPIPQPFLSQPLKEAKFVGQAKGVEFESDHI